MVQIRNSNGYLMQNDDSGPFDIIGDVHGCFDELKSLLNKLGYQINYSETDAKYKVIPSTSRKAVFVGDLVDRGPNSPEVLRLVMDMVQAGLAYCVVGNHDDKLYRKLCGRNVQVRHGLELTMEQLGKYRREFVQRIRIFLECLPHHIMLDNGRLVIAHAGLKEHLHGKHGKTIRDLCLYGPTTGALDEKGLPVRLDWAADYSGTAIVVYGHTPVHTPTWKNNTLNIDTGCVFGGKLTALTYPDNILTSVDAQQAYAEPMRPFLTNQV